MRVSCQRSSRRPSRALTLLAVVAVAAPLTVVGGPSQAEAQDQAVPAYQNPARSVRERVADLLGRMTLADKIGQMTQAERGAISDPADIATYHLGSLLSGGGSVPTPNTPSSCA